MFYWIGVSYIYRSGMMKKRSKDGRRVRGAAEGEIYRGGDLYIEIIAMSQNDSKTIREGFGATRSYAMNCKRATPSVWGNLTGMCLGSNAEVQSSWDNVKKSKNPLWTIC